MPSGCSLDLMMIKMPHRTFDVGIAEQHAVTFAAGMATEGFLPFCNIYSTFMQRAYDQLIHDVALQKLNVVFCLDRAGLVGEDGPTHHGAFDMAYLRAIPNIAICSPMNEQELRNMMFTAQLENKGPIAIRYPRGRGTMKNWKTPFEEIQIGKGRIIKEGRDLAIISIGDIGNEVVKACEMLEKEGLSATQVDIRFLKPLDHLLLAGVFKKFEQIITVEDGTTTGGLGSAVIELMNDLGFKKNVVRLGIPDRFIEHGAQQQLWQECGYDAGGIVSTALKLTEKQKVEI
jgi:1-deoxy-D-xylulose-5-phosphate synthase